MANNYNSNETMKLKTLKDLNFSDCFYDDTTDYDEIWKVLREEVKKHWQKLEEDHKRLLKEELDGLRGQDHGLEIDHSKIGAVQDWIKTFFNLEGEDE